MQEKEFEPMSKELEENELESVVGGIVFEKTTIHGDEFDVNYSYCINELR